MAVYYLVYGDEKGVKMSKMEAIRNGLYMPYSDLQIKTRKVGNNGTMEDFKRFAKANNSSILSEGDFEAYLVRLPEGEQYKHKNFIEEMLRR